MIAPKVSIIIPVYNAAQTLDAAINSVISQTYSAIEIIVVDGMSTDGSDQILQKYSSQIHHLIREKDQGVYDAMNKGITKASGDWIYLMGADDQLATMDVMAKVMSEVDQDHHIVFGKVVNTDRNHPLVPKIHTSRFDGVICLRNTLHQQSVFYRKDLFDKHKFNPQYKILADYDFHLTLFEEKVKGKYLDILIARCEAGGLSKNFNWALYREEIVMKRTHVAKQGWLFRLLYIPSVIGKFVVKKIFK